MKGAIALVIAATPCGGCVASSTLFEGPLVWAIVMGAESVDPLPPLRVGTAVMVVANTEAGSDLEQDSWIDDAVVSMDAGAGDVEMEWRGDGVYLSKPPISFALHAPEEQMLVGTASFLGETHEIGQIAPPPIASGEYLTHPVDTKLVVEVPRGLDVAYTAVLAQLMTADGTEIWNNFPKDGRGWLNLLATDRVPKSISVPATAFDQADVTIGLAIYALRADDDTFTATRGLHSVLSGFVTGSTLTLPIDVTP